MKNKKKVFIISGIALALVIAIVVIAVTASGKGQGTVNPNDDPTEPTVSIGDDVTIEIPSENPSERDKDTLPLVEDDGNALTLTDGGEPGSSGGSVSQGRAGTAAEPVSGNTPEERGGGGSNIYNDDDDYDCGVAGHHCDGPETHAYILNLEIEGCPYCGSHSCPSFYATDEWGNSCYTPSKCPKYDAHKDPAEYCQECGKHCGDGSNGTCVQFVESCNCPNCGEWVEVNTCHTCKK